MSSHQGFDIESLYKNCQMACKCLYSQEKECDERVTTRKNDDEIANITMELKFQQFTRFLLMKKVIDLEEQFKSLKEEYLKQKEEIGSLKEEIGSLFIAVEDLKKKNDELFKKNDELFKKNDDLTITVENLNQRVANLEDKHKNLSIGLSSERLLLVLNLIINNFNLEERNERNKVAHAEACKDALNNLSQKDQQRFYKELKNYLQTRPSDMPDIVKRVLLPETEDVSNQVENLIAELESLAN
jgi:signal transduction protein with GAF and PtsI domain